MSVGTAPAYPGGSKSRVNKAGAAIRAGKASADDLACIDLWRAAHAPVLNTFQAILRGRAKKSKAVVAQRHKRKMTIFGKLDRYPNMDLARMDDIAGCRLIFDSLNALQGFRDSLHAAKFKHKRRNEKDKYDYLKHPKNSGYRGIHDIYEYDVKSSHGEKYKGLFIELQYRTGVQHAWATAVEIIGFITSNQPKFSQGDQRYQDAMSLASEILARVYEGSRSCHPDLEDTDLVRKFVALDDEIGLLDLLRSLNSSDDDEPTARRNFILIFKEGKALEVRAFRNAGDALRALFELEGADTGQDIVYVKGDSTDDIRIAFRNYFSDAGEFIRLVEEGCEKLSVHKVIRSPKTQPAKPNRHERRRDQSLARKR